MSNEGQFKKLEDRVNALRARPSVGVFIDLDSLLMDIEEALDTDTYETIRDPDIAETVLRVAQASGRPSQMAVYYSIDLAKEDEIEYGAWRSRNITPVDTPQEGYTKEDVNLPLILDAYEGAVEGKFEVCILVVGQTDYTALARRLMERGITVLMVSNYPPNRRKLPRDNCAYIPLRPLFSDLGHASVDPDEFDYDQLIRLLYESENRMPFVGVRYFIRDVMWRLGEGFKNTTTCQRIFQGAKDRNLVEVYKTTNVNPNRKEVSACRLIRDSDHVTSVIEEVERRTRRTSEDDGTVQVRHETLISPEATDSHSPIQNEDSPL